MKVKTEIKDEISENLDTLTLRSKCMDVVSWQDQAQHSIVNDFRCSWHKFLVAPSFSRLREVEHYLECVTFSSDPSYEDISLYQSASQIIEEMADTTVTMLKSINQIEGHVEPIMWFYRILLRISLRKNYENTELVLIMVSSFLRQVPMESNDASAGFEYQLTTVLQLTTELLQKISVSEHCFHALLSCGLHCIFSETMLAFSSNENFQFLMSSFLVEIHKQSLRCFFAFVPTELISVWLIKGTKSDFVAHVMLDLLDTDDDRSEFTQSERRSQHSDLISLSHVMIESCWKSSTVSAFREFISIIAEGLCSPKRHSAEKFITPFLFTMFRLSWHFKSETYTIAVFETLRILHDPLERVRESVVNCHDSEDNYLSRSLIKKYPEKDQWTAFSSESLINGYYTQITELVCQLASCESLTEHYQPSLFMLLDKVTTKMPSLIRIDWFNRISYSNLSICESLIPLTWRYATKDSESSNTNLGPFNKLYWRIITSSYVPSSGVVKRNLLEFLKSVVRSSENSCVWVWNYLLLGIIECDSSTRMHAISICMSLMEDDAAFDGLMRVFKNTKTLQKMGGIRYGIASFLHSVQLRPLSSKRKARLEFQIGGIVNEFLRLDETVLSSQIVQLNGNYLPKIWWRSGLGVINCLKARLHDKLAWTKMIKSVLKSSDLHTMGYMNIMNVFMLFFNQLRSCDPCLIEPFGAVLGVLITKRNPWYIEFQYLLHTLVDRVTRNIMVDEIDAESQTLARLVLIWGVCRYWSVPEDRAHEIAFNLITLQNRTRNTDLCYAIVKTVVSLCGTYPTLLHEPFIMKYCEEITRGQSTGVSVWMGYWMLMTLHGSESFTPGNFSSNNIQIFDNESTVSVFVQCIYPRAIRLAYASENIYALKMAILSVENGYVVANDCIPLVIALSFSTNKLVAQMAVAAFTKFRSCWPRETILKFSAGLRIIKSPYSHMHHFPLIWNCLEDGRPKRDIHGLIEQLGDLFRTANDELMIFLIRGLSLIQFDHKESEKLASCIESTCLWSIYDELHLKQDITSSFRTWLLERRVGKGQTHCMKPFDCDRILIRYNRKRNHQHPEK